MFLETVNALLNRFDKLFAVQSVSQIFHKHLPAMTNAIKLK
jgi:hypothetical protein